MVRKLPANRYLDYYLLVSEIEFITIAVDKYNIIIKKKGYEFPPEKNIWRDDVVGAKRLECKRSPSLNPIFFLFLRLEQLILSDIYGLNKSGSIEKYQIQHSMHYNPQQYIDWYKQFNSDPLFLIKVIKKNLQFASIASKDFTYYDFTQPVFDKTFEIVAVKLTHDYSDNKSFVAEIWLHSIDNKDECYMFSAIFASYHLRDDKCLAYAMAWHNRKIESNKPENKRYRLAKKNAVKRYQETGDWDFIENVTTTYGRTD